MQRVILGVFLAFEALLVGCETTFDHDALSARTFAGADFSAALAEEYRALALFEAREMFDWPDAGRFGHKALRAGDGQMPAPERLEDWRLPAEAKEELTAARRRLIAAIAEGAPRVAPAAAAHAQASFDCWVEQQEENWQLDHIAHCRKGFYQAIGDAEAGVRTARVVLASGRSAAGPEQSAVVFFPFDSASLDSATLAVVRELVGQAVAGGDAVRIHLGGHTDRVGSDGYNLALSWRRANAVRTAFVEAGLPATMLTVSGHGESRPRVPTPDGAEEPMNRRVEISLGTAVES